jgi:hypothetical protein
MQTMAASFAESNPRRWGGRRAEEKEEHFPLKLKKVENVHRIWQ